MKAFTFVICVLIFDYFCFIFNATSEDIQRAKSSKGDGAKLKGLNHNVCDRQPVADTLKSDNVRVINNLNMVTVCHKVNGRVELVDMVFFMDRISQKPIISQG